MAGMSAAEILALSLPERMKLIEALRDSIAHAPESPPLGEGERADLAKRLAANQKDPEAGSPWPEVRKRLQQRA